MGLRIATNVAALSAQRNLRRSNEQTSHAIRALSSGSRIVDAGDDAAGFAISESLRGQAASLGQAKQNAENATGFIQVAEGGLNEQNNIVIRLRELAVQSASDTVSDDERGFLDTEFQQLLQEFDRIAATTRYGSKQLLVGDDKKYEFYLGTTNDENSIIRYNLDTDTRSSALGIKGLSVSDRDDARGLLTDLDQAAVKLAQARAGFGAMQSRLAIAGNNLDVQKENILAARGRIADADVAEEVSKMVAGQVQQELGISVLAQANQAPARALKLL
jgi:flagellin